MIHSRHETKLTGMNRAQVCVLEKRHQICFSGLLQAQDGGGLEAEIVLKVLGDLSHEALEGEFADEEVGGLLVAADLAQGHSAGAVSVRLLHRRRHDACEGERTMRKAHGKRTLTPPVLGALMRAAWTATKQLRNISGTASRHHCHNSPNASGTAFPRHKANKKRTREVPWWPASCEGPFHRCFFCETDKRQKRGSVNRETHAGSRYNT